MPRYRVTVWADYATIHEVEAEDEASALAAVHSDPATTETGTYHGDSTSEEVDEIAKA